MRHHGWLASSRSRASKVSSTGQIRQQPLPQTKPPIHPSSRRAQDTALHCSLINLCRNSALPYSSKAHFNHRPPTRVAVEHQAQRGAPLRPIPTVLVDEHLPMNVGGTHDWMPCRHALLVVRQPGQGCASALPHATCCFMRILGSRDNLSNSFTNGQWMTQATLAHSQRLHANRDMNVHSPPSRRWLFRPSAQQWLAR